MKQGGISLVKKILGLCGLEVRRVQNQVPRYTMRGFLQQAVKNGLLPMTVIDVGAATGTPAIYESFPDAYHLLIEPLEENIPYLEKWKSKLKYSDYILAAAASYSGEVVINVHPDLVGSSIYKENEDSDVNGLARTVSAVTLDQIYLEKKLNRPCVLKVDVQGAELDVLIGAALTLENSELVVLEIVFFDFFDNSFNAFNCINFMKEKGFVIYDIFDISYRLLDGAMSQADFAFVKEDSKLRQYHYYATREQRTIQDKMLLNIEYY
jgi:FkbM family methyltransferase